MPTIYVIQQQTKLRIRNRRLQVERDPEAEHASQPAEVLLSVPLGQVSQVVVFGNVGLTTPAIEAFLAQETEVVFLTRQGEYRGQLVGPLTPHVPLRRAQYRRLEQPGFALRLAQGFVTAKLQHQRALLLRNTRDQRPLTVSEAAERLNAALEAVTRKTSLESLRGLEGASTAAYFGGLRSFFGP
jgi:CRISPR-associated protein Cas1